MVDKVEKALRKLSDKERRAVKAILNRIKAGHIADLDIKKLKGSTSVYRVRKGTLRIIFAGGKKGIKILAVERRSERTYRTY
jgi:mRNA-degrading endonuclease RelE of RelBE toxin-antitoxin system